MSTEKFINKFIKKDKNRATIIGASLILLATIGIGLIGYFIGKRNNPTANLPIPVVDLSQYSRQKVLGTSVYSWSGKIIKVEKSKIIISANLKGKDGKITEKQLTVNIKSSTEIVKIDLSRPAPTNTENSRIPISSDQLQNGQPVVIKSNNDLNHDEIEATSISVVVMPTTT